MAVFHVSKENFQKEVLENKGVVLVNFYAEWCGPCRMTSPIIEELANEMKNIKIVKINVDEDPELASQYSIFSIPTFLIFKEGKVASQIVGAKGKEGFLEEINKVIE